MKRVEAALEFSATEEEFFGWLDFFIVRWPSGEHGEAIAALNVGRRTEGRI